MLTIEDVHSLGKLMLMLLAGVSIYCAIAFADMERINRGKMKFFTADFWMYELFILSILAPFALWLLMQ